MSKDEKSELVYLLSSLCPVTESGCVCTVDVGAGDAEERFLSLKPQADISSMNTKPVISRNCLCNFIIKSPFIMRNALKFVLSSPYTPAVMKREYNQNKCDTRAQVSPQVSLFDKDKCRRKAQNGKTLDISIY